MKYNSTITEIQLPQDAEFFDKAVKLLDRLMLKYDLTDDDFNDVFEVIKQYEIRKRYNH